MARKSNVNMMESKYMILSRGIFWAQTNRDDIFVSVKKWVYRRRMHEITIRNFYKNTQKVNPIIRGELMKQWQYFSNVWLVHSFEHWPLDMITQREFSLHPEEVKQVFPKFRDELWTFWSLMMPYGRPWCPNTRWTTNYCLLTICIGRGWVMSLLL